MHDRDSLVQAAAAAVLAFANRGANADELAAEYERASEEYIHGIMSKNNEHLKRYSETRRAPASVKGDAEFQYRETEREEFEVRGYTEALLQVIEAVKARVDKP